MYISRIYLYIYISIYVYVYMHMYKQYVTRVNSPWRISRSPSGPVSPPPLRGVEGVLFDLSAGLLDRDVFSEYF